VRGDTGFGRDELLGEYTTAHDTSRVTDEEIARRAFEIYCERSCHDGHDLDDWLRAERKCHAKPASDVPIRFRVNADRRLRRGLSPLFDRCV